MKVLVLGAGGVGAAVGAVAQRRDFVDRLVLADVSEARARAAAERTGDARFSGIALDASDAAAIAAAARAHEADAILTALNPVVALELLATGVWSGAGVLAPEAFPPGPFLELLAEYGAPHGVEDR